MKNAEIEIIRYKKETVKIVIQLPDEFEENLQSARVLGENLVNSNLVDEKKWVQTEVEFAGASWTISGEVKPILTIEEW